MKRYISLALILVLLPFMLATPARADTDDSFLNVLDFAVTDETGNNSISLVNGVATASYTLPWRMSTQYVDVLFTYYETTRQFDSVEVYHSNGSTLLGSLTVERVNENVWRAFGNISSTYTTRLMLRFQITGAQGTHITIYRFNISPMTNVAQPIEGECLISAPGLVDTIIYRPTDPTNSRTWTSDGGSGSLLLSSDDWYLYDYLDFCVYVKNSTKVGSVVCTFDGLSVPFTVTRIPESTPDVLTSYYSIRVDLRNVNREIVTSSLGPCVKILLMFDSGPCLVTVDSIHGLVSTDSVSPLAFWFNQTGKWIFAQTSSITGSITGLGDNINGMLTSMTNTILGSLHSIGNSIRSGVDQIVAALSPDNDASDVNNKLQDSLGQLGDAGAVMDSISRPDMNQIDFNVTAMVPASGLSFMASIVNTVYDNDLIGPLMLIFCTMALASFLIFGRR